MTNTVDPLAGSYYVESLTNQIEMEAGEYIRRIDGMGGVIEAIESGYTQQEIQKAAYRYSRELEEGGRIVVGVNKYQTMEDPPQDILTINKKVRDDQIASLNEVRSQRNQSDVREKLDDLKRSARTVRNLLPPILEAVRVYATVGEICDTLRSVFGEYRETTAL